MASLCPAAPPAGPVNNMSAQPFQYWNARAVPPGYDRDICVVPCFIPGSCLADGDMTNGGSKCAIGYANTAPPWRCGQCDVANNFYMSAGRCVKCPVAPQVLLVIYVVAVLFIAGASYFLERANIHVAFASIGIDFFQVVSSFAGVNANWPTALPSLRTLLVVLSAANLNIEVVAPECYLPGVTYISKFSGIVVIPLALAAILAVVHTVLLFTKVAIMGRRTNVGRHSHVLVSTLLVLMYYLYLYETQTLLGVFDCRPTSPPGPPPIATYLVGTFEPCTLNGALNGAHATLLAPAIIGLIIYTAGYPAFVAALLWKHKELIMEDQLLRAKGVGEDRLTNPHAYEFRKRYGALYYQFRPDAYFWLLVILLRKFFVVLVPVMFNESPSFGMAAVLMVLMCAYGLQVRV